MSLRDVPPKVHYISGVDDLVNDFYIPTLSHSSIYQRRTGYFNSRALAMASRGLSGLLRNHGKMQLICSVELEENERDVYEEATKQLGIMERKSEVVARMLEKPYDELERDRLALLAEFLSQGLLEIKIAYPKMGIYHEKVGIFKDHEGNIIAFSGSDNETPGGWENNTESFHAFNSWEDMRHIDPEIDTFDKLWRNELPGTTVISLPEAVKKGILKYKLPEVWKGTEKSDPIYKKLRPQQKLAITPQMAYIIESSRLWNHSDFAFSEVGVEPFEHQDYVAASVLKDWPPRCMLCDEVGLGKTIEAGLILHGFLQAGRLNRVIILAPKNILKQWQLQLLSKFNIIAWRLDGNYAYAPQPDPNVPVVRVKVDAINPFRTKPIMLVSSQLVRSDARLAQLCELEYDLAFVDEAHHARARGPKGKRRSNRLLDALEQLKMRTQGLIFMTATPIQLDRKELWDLLMILELPGNWQDEEKFDTFYREINQEVPDWAFLFAMVEGSIKIWGVDEDSITLVREQYPKLDAEALMQRIKDGRHQDVRSLSKDEKEALKVLLFRHTPVFRMIYRNTRELLKQYHREGKFKERIAEREAVPPDSITLNGRDGDLRSELGLYNKIDEYVRDYYAKYEGIREGLGFVMMVYRKRLTSSFYAIKLSLARRKETLANALETEDYGTLLRRAAEEDEDEEEEDLPEDIAEGVEEGKLSSTARQLMEMRQVLQAEHDFLDSFIGELQQLPTDSKFEYLAKMLREKLNRGVRRVIIFSQFRDTVDFLLESLKPHYGEKLGSYTGEGGSYYSNGRWVKCSKQAIQDKFRTDTDPLSILICTDAASEGLDLQSCDTLINYDIPWNPMRIEQRIGRVDRIGQKSEKVYIHTLYYHGTVEQDVYSVCLERLEEFRSTLGNMQPVLVAGDVQRIIKQGAMARTKEERDRVHAGMRDELDKSIAQVEENMRIFHFLNHYTPQLNLAKGNVPFTQSEMEEAMAPALTNMGWVKNGALWSKESEMITFDPKVLDQKDVKANLISSSFEPSHLFGKIGALPNVVEGDGVEMRRIALDSTVGFIARDSEGWHVVMRMNDLILPTQQAFSTAEEAENSLRFIYQQRRLASVRSQTKVWENRRESWEARVHLYLDNVLNYVWTQKGSALFLDEGAVMRAWREYMADKDRELTVQLERNIRYSPSLEAVKPKAKGRPSKAPVRSSEKEERYLAEAKEIAEKLSFLKRQELDLLG